MIDERFRVLPLGCLVEAEWNPNRCSAGVMARLRHSIERFELVENLVARPHPSLPGMFEVLSGNHRLRVLVELGYGSVPVAVLRLDDGQARLLAQTLNRTRGKDDPKAYATLLEQVLADYPVSEAVALLPETEATIDQILAEHGSKPRTEEVVLLPPASPDSQPGAVYELGPHRLLCGDATDPEQIASFLGGETAGLMVTDPPYGVGLDHGWRDGLRQRRGSARAGKLANDDRCDWREAFVLTDAPVAYVWHSALHVREAFDGLEAAGFEVRQELVWMKPVQVLGRAHYPWRHESCLYAVRKGCSANWQGGRKQTTVFELASPIMATSSTAAEDAVTRHPTQKPLALFERLILNHTAPGGMVYDPFGGSGSCLIAAERSGRRCFMVEIDPGWCDVIRDRYASHLTAGKAG